MIRPPQRRLSQGHGHRRRGLKRSQRRGRADSGTEARKFKTDEVVLGTDGGEKGSGQSLLLHKRDEAETEPILSR